jgi:hypothetical protein
MASPLPNTIPPPSLTRESVPCTIVPVKHANGLTDQLPLAAMQPPGKAFPVHDAAHDAFMTLPAHTNSSENEVELVGSDVMRHAPVVLIVDSSENIRLTNTLGRLTESM